MKRTAVIGLMPYCVSSVVPRIFQTVLVASIPKQHTPNLQLKQFALDTFVSKQASGVPSARRGFSLNTSFAINK